VSSGRRGALRRGRGGCADAGERRPDGHGLVFADEDLLEHAGGGCGNLGVDLVGGDLQERFVDLDGLADPFEPRGDGAAGD